MGDDPGVAGGDGVPELDHQRRIVGEVALLFGDVFLDLIGSHDGLRLEDQRRGGDPRERIERLDQQMGFLQVLAGSALFLPQERHRIHPHHLDAGVRQEQHLAGHRVEDIGIRVVQVPLEIVEGRPDPFPQRRPVGEGAGMRVREDGPQGFLVLVRFLAVGIHPVIFQKLVVALRRLLRPLVLVRGVVEDEIQHQAHPLLPELRRKLAQALHRADLRIELPVAADRVAAVIVSGRALEKRHQVQVGHSQLIEIADLIPQPFQILGKEIHIRHRTEDPVRLVPMRVPLADRIEAFQIRIAVQP